MDKTITLNETQVKLIQEFQAANEELKKTRETGPENSDEGYLAWSNKMCDLHNARERAACVFAESVAEVLK